MVPRRSMLGLALALAGCITRSLPVPPPMATVQGITACEPAVCPAGGVTVTVGGTAFAGALVIVEDANPASVGVAGEALVGAARALADGTWRAVLAPQRDAAGVRAPQRGDVLNVYQITAAGETSQSTFVTIPR